MKRIHLLLLALLALFAGAPFRAAAEETFRDRVGRHPRRGGLPDQQTKLRLHEPHPEKSAGGAGARGNIRFEHARRPGLGDQRDDDEKHPAAHHSHLRLRKPQGHVRRGAHLRGVRQNLHGSRLLHRRSGHHHLIRRGNGSRHAQESGKRLLGLYPLRRDGKGLPARKW